MTEEQEDIIRSVVVVGTLYGLRRNRLNPMGDEVPLGAQELSATIAPDRRLVVLGHDPIAGFPRAHGTVADEAAMLALHTLDAAGTVLEPRFVAPGDSVLRSDDPGWRWHCISGHGQSLSDWERRPLGGALSGLAVSGHTHEIAAITGLGEALASLDSGKADIDHTHAISDVTGLINALAGKQSTLANAAALARITAGTNDLPLWDNEEWPGGGGSGSGWTVSATPPPALPASLVWQANGDANGLFYALGSLLGTAAWQNPISRGNLKCLLSNSGAATAASLSDRATNSNNYWTGGAGPWVAWDLGAGTTCAVTDYLLREGANLSYVPKYWAIEGTNSISQWTIAGVAAASWTAIDTRANDPTLDTGYSNVWGRFLANGDTTTQYRYLRMRWTTTISYAILGEAEFYGLSSISRPATLPATAAGWMTDDAGHYVPYWSS